MITNNRITGGCRSASCRALSVKIEVLAFSDPAAAVRHFEDHTDDADLVLTDLTMPHMTGVELAARMHALNPGLPVMLMIGYGVASSQAASAQFAQVVNKPENGDELVGFALSVLAGQAG